MKIIKVITTTTTTTTNKQVKRKVALTSEKLIKEKLKEFLHADIKEVLRRFVIETSFNIAKVINIIADKFSKIVNYPTWMLETELKRFYLKNYQQN